MGNTFRFVAGKTLQTPEELEITAKITRHDRVTSGYATELNDLPKTAEERYKYKRNISGEFFMVFDVDPLKKLGI